MTSTTRVVIAHPKDGIYLGSAMGLGFWSLLDSAGQTEAAAFPGMDEAKTFMATWESQPDIGEYSFVEVPCQKDYATLSDLKAAGLGHMLGDMEANAQKLANERAAQRTPSSDDSGGPSF